MRQPDERGGTKIGQSVAKAVTALFKALREGTHIRWTVPETTITSLFRIEQWATFIWVWLPDYSICPKAGQKNPACPS